MNWDMAEVGIALYPDFLPLDKMIELASQVDKLEYSQISVPEIWGYDAFTFLTLLAAKTENVKLASGIVNMFSRTPATMAMTAAALDRISKGRFILGLGLSGPKVIEDWHGMKFVKPLTRTREYVNIVRSILNRERMNHKTTQLGNIKDFRISVRDIKNDIPIHLASLGPKNVKLTAEIADGWIPIIMPFSDFKNEIAKIKKFLDRFNKKKSEFAITPFVPTLVGAEDETKQTLRNHLAYYFGGMGDFYNNMLVRFGYQEEALEIKQRWMKMDPKGAADAISDQLLDEIAILGSEDEVLERVKSISHAGATSILINVPFKATWDQAMKTFLTFAPANENLA